MPNEPDDNRVCVACGAPFQVPASSPATRCPPCNLAHATEATLRANAEIAREEERLHRRARNAGIVRWVSLAVLGLGSVFIKYQMRKEYARSRAPGDDYMISDSPPEHASHGDPRRGFEALADEMCACGDTACATQVQESYQRYVETSDDIEEGQRAPVQAAIERLDGCRKAVWDKARSDTQP